MKDLSNENIIHVKKDGIQYIQFKRLLEYKDKLCHCYTFKELDFKHKTNDDIDYKKICNALHLNNQNIVRPHQTHTDTIKVVNKESVSNDFNEVDGLITNEKNKVLSLTFADCMPIILYDPVKNIIGNIHSGWRGTVQKIGQKAVKKMVEEYDCNIKDIICCIGPTIRKCHFEVEDDVKEIFQKAFDNYSIIEDNGIINGKHKYHIDAVKANIDAFKEIGIHENNIIDSGICTVCNSDIIHSYRAEKDESGRNTLIISLI